MLLRRVITFFRWEDTWQTCNYAILVSHFLLCLFLSAYMSHAAGSRRDANRNRADLVRDKQMRLQKRNKSKEGIKKKRISLLSSLPFLLNVPKLQRDSRKHRIRCCYSCASTCNRWTCQWMVDGRLEGKMNLRVHIISSVPLCHRVFQPLTLWTLSRGGQLQEDQTWACVQSPISHESLWLTVYLLSHYLGAQLRSFLFSQSHWLLISAASDVALTDMRWLWPHTSRSFRGSRVDISPRFTNQCKQVLA